jgi:acyl-CoA synthetase (NDP forming)
VARVAERAPQARIEGVLVSPMIEGGVETIAGVKHDPLFGPVVVFGLGGVFVEVLGDAAVEPAPFGLATAHALIRRIKGYPLLAGARGSPPADLDALADVLARLSVFGARNVATLGSMEINPLIARPEGALALDALALPKV